MKFSFVVLAAVTALAFAGCTRYTVEVRTYEELSKALNEARPGANISLAPGVYYGSLSVSVKGNISDPSCSVIIDGHDKATLSSSDKWAVRFDNCVNVLMKDVEISKANDYGAFLVDSEYVQLSSCKFSHIEHVGVMIMGGQWNTIESCSFSYIKENPVWIGETQTSDNQVQYCEFQDGLGGDVVLLDTGSVRTSINRCYFNGRDSSYYRWIHARGTGSSVIDNFFEEDKYNKNFSEGVFTEGSNNYYRRNSMKIYETEKFGFFNKGTDETICLTNVVSGGGQRTNGPVDNSC